MSFYSYSHITKPSAFCSFANEAWFAIPIWAVSRRHKFTHFPHANSIHNRIPKYAISDTSHKLHFYTQFHATCADQFHYKHPSDEYFSLSIWVFFFVVAPNAFACRAQNFLTPDFLNIISLTLYIIYIFTHNFIPHALMRSLATCPPMDISHFPFGPFSLLLWRTHSLATYRLHNLVKSVMSKYADDNKYRKVVDAHGDCLFHRLQIGFN